jgi:hypothetical protein
MFVWTQSTLFMNNLLFLFNKLFIELELVKSQTFEVHIDPNINDFSKDIRKKIAVWGLPDNLNNDTTLPLIRDMSSMDLLVLYNPEDLAKAPALVHRDIIQSFNCKNYIVLSGGYNTAFYYDPSIFYCNLFTHGHVSKLVSEPDCDNTNAQYDFECLFGTVRPARQYLYYKLLDTGLLENTIMNLQHYQREFFDDPNHDLFWPNISLDHEKKYGAIEQYRSGVLDWYEADNRLPHDNLEDFFVRVLTNTDSKNINGYFERAYRTPDKIYSLTKYSLIQETYQSMVFHPTEKTAKAFLGKRVFIMFSCKNFLKFIKERGFKTFNAVIDESYDDIEDTRERFDMAFEQVVKLSQMDHKHVYQQLKDVLEHNYNLMQNTYQHYTDIEEFIKSSTP